MAAKSNKAKRFFGCHYARESIDARASGGFRKAAPVASALLSATAAKFFAHRGGHKWRYAVMREPKSRSSSRLTAADYGAINAAAQASLHIVLKTLFPKRSGKRIYVNCAFTQDERSFDHLEINRLNGKWHDYDSGCKGDGPLSLVSFVMGISGIEAASLLAQMLQSQKSAGQIH
jgi:hypothetical protein